MIATAKVNRTGITAGVERYRERLRNRVKPKVSESKDRAYTLMRSLVPVGTEPLEPGDRRTRDKIKQELTHGGLGYKVGFDKDAGPVPRFLEYGTRHMTAQPSVQPTKDAELPRFRSETIRAAKGR
jgi:HK97 gp10 family phage protein